MNWIKEATPKNMPKNPANENSIITKN